jgi:putative oxidoreductase
MTLKTSCASSLRCLCQQSWWLKSLSLLSLRLWIAKVFFLSGLTKIQSWDATLALFADEYQVPLLPPDLAAHLSAAGELFLPVLLVLGLATPLAALGLFAMTLVIEFFVYPGTTEHYYWMLMLGVLISHGSGRWGLDWWIGKKWSAKAASTPSNPPTVP